MDATMSTSEARQDFAEVINRVAYGRERIGVHRRGRNLVAVIPWEDLQAFEEWEDAQDVAASRRALAEMKAAGEKPIPWEEAKSGLED